VARRSGTARRRRENPGILSAHEWAAFFAERGDDVIDGVLASV